MSSRQSRRADEVWPPGGDLDSDADCVELNLPAKPPLWRVARMTVSSIGAVAGFDVEQIGDLRIAIDELCTICGRGGGPTTILSIVARWDEHSLLVSCTASPLAADRHDDPPDPAPAEALPPGLSQDELAERILEALVDAYGIDSSQSGVRRAWLRKSR
jgi:hypothetical protein